MAFDLSGMKQVKISGTDTQFLLHTDILPFHIDRCREICIEGITIDYARTGYSEGKIVEVTDKKMLLEINREEYPYQVIHGNIFFEEENGIDELYCGCLEMDAKRCAPVWRGQDISFNRPYQSSYGAFFQEAGENLVEISLTGGGEVSRNIKVGEYSDPAASLEDASVLLSYRQRRCNIKTYYDLSLYRDGSHITVYKQYYNRTGGYTKTPGKEENVYGDSGWISFCVCRWKNSDQRLPGGKSAG